jgi:ATP-binding cassette, subfamily B, bacterial
VRRGGQGPPRQAFGVVARRYPWSVPRGSRHFPLLLSEEEQRPIRPATIRRVVDAFRPYRRKVGLVLVTILLTSSLGVVNPLLIKVVFDEALFTPEGVILGTLFVLVGIMVAVPVVSGVINVWQTYLSNVVGQRVMQDLRNALYRHLQRMPLRFFTNTRTGEIQSRLANDVGGVQKVVTDTASDTLSNGVIVLTTIIAMLILSWQLTLLAVGMIPVFLWLTYKVGKARQRVAASTQQSMAEVSAITQETLSVSGMLLSKAFGRQGYEVDRFGRENQRLADLQLRQQLIGRSFFAVIYSFISITTLKPTS